MGYFSPVVLLFILVSGTLGSTRVNRTRYDSSYAFLNVRSSGSPSEGHDFCVNFQQFRTRTLPKRVEQAPRLSIAWWNNRFNETDVCTSSSSTFEENSLVPALYRTNRRGTNCTRTSEEYFISQQLGLLEKQNASSVLFLMARGERNLYGLRDFLFSQFSNPEINETNHKADVFYAYRQAFFEDILPNLEKEGTELRIYRPANWFLDPSVFVIWFLAVFCITAGCLWMVYETKNVVVPMHSASSRGVLFSNVEDGTPMAVEQPVDETSPSQPVDSVPPVSSTTETQIDLTTEVKPKPMTDSEKLAQMSAGLHCVYVMVFVAFVVGVLLLSFFFRPYAVMFFNVFLVILGTVSIHSLLYSMLLALLHSDYEVFSLATLFCCYTPGCLVLNSKFPALNRLSKSRFFQGKIRLISTLALCFALGISLTWFFNRSNPYSFFLLDFINACLCIYAIRGTQVRSFRLLTFLLLAMFVYDVIMVFGTRLLTPSGCSVMLQVVTGVDCSSSASVSRVVSVENMYPVAPVDVVTPEKIPILFYVPILADPMAKCFDLAVEGEFKHVMLGLGDVIVPGYLIAFCFYVDLAKRNRYYSYGLIGLLGYSLGCVATFLALRLMETAQPALIYLVPFTLLPISLWACYQRSFLQIWRGELPPL